MRLPAPHLRLTAQGKARLLLLALSLLSACKPASLDAFLYSTKKAPKEGYTLSTAVIPAYDNFTVQTADGVTLDAIFVPSGGARADVTIYYCHGNGTHIGSAWERIELLYPLGTNLLVFDYRGYGKSTGSPTEKGVQLDLRTMRAALLDKPGVDPGRLVYYGRSLGGATCIDLAATDPPRALITESTFASVQALVTDGVSYELPGQFVIDSQWDSLAKIRTIGSPYLALHGLADDFVQPKYSAELVGAHPGPWKALVYVEGADHGDVPQRMGEGAYRDRVAAFIDASAAVP